MASITFEGPDPLNLVERSTSVAKFSDETMMATVEAICKNYGYSFTVKNDSNVDIPNPTGPGTFAIEQILAFCRDNVVSYNTNKAQETARNAVTAALAGLETVTLV